MKHFINLFSRRYLLFVLFVALGVVANAREITNNSHKINGVGIDEHGVYIEFYVAYYNDKGTDNEMYSSKWWMELNGTTYYLFETSLKHQDDASSYWCYFRMYDYPMIIRPNDGSTTRYYYPGQAYWNGAYDREYKWQKVTCPCESLADAYVRVYLPNTFWGKSPTFKMTSDWDGTDYDGQRNFGTKTLSNPDYYRATNFLSYEPSSTTGKMKVNMQFTGSLNSNYAYTPTVSSNMTLTDNDLLNNSTDKKFVAEYTASKTASTGSLSVVCTQKNTQTYTQTLQIYATESYPKKLTFPIKHSYTWTNEPALGACTYVKNLVVTPNQLTKSFTLTWDKQVMNNITNGTFYIYRYTYVNGSFSNGKFVAEKLSYNTSSYTDTGLAYDTKYRYVVFFVANTWSNITTPITDLGESKDATITRSFPITLKVSGNAENISLSWTYPASDKKVTFKIYRKYGNNSYGEAIATQTATSTDAGTATYTDGNVVSGTSYTYKVEAVDVMEMSFTSNEDGGRMGSATEVKSIVVSKGEYTDRVKLSWTVKQVGTAATRYKVSRKLINDSDDAYSQIYTTEGTGETYYYDDCTALPGQYYKYKVGAYPAGTNSSGGTEYNLKNSLVSDGFSTAKGIVNGRVTYGTGTAVPNAKVILAANDMDEGLAQFHSLYVADFGGGVRIPVTESENIQLYNLFNEHKAFSIELWLRPETDIRETATSTAQVTDACVLSIQNMGSVDVRACNAERTEYNLVVNIPDGKNVTNLKVSSSAFSHITYSYDGNSHWSLRLFDGEELQTWEKDCTTACKTGTHKITIGNPEGSKTYNFMGYIDEIRLWSKCLTDEEILKYAGRTLSGSENGLKVYLPLDEGITDQETAYDYSKTGGVANGVHGTIGTSTYVSDEFPTENQLSLHGITDEQGNYTIMGVPFVGEGTSYTVRPTLGIHEFSPKYLTRFVNGNSLNHSGVDFEDVSSFSVSGKVIYDNSDYPVDGCNVYVDGTICAKDGTPIETYEDGTFTISVPIGAHYITVKKAGHVFANDGRYPAGDGNTHEFTKVISDGQAITFTDKTLVNFSGRVVGGDIEHDKLLGFGLSKNNIGVTEIKLEPTASKYYINTSGSLVNLESAAKKINSSSWLGEDGQSVYIHTDAETGEFSAMVPPLKYKLTKMEVIKNKEGIELMKSDDTQEVDLSNPQDVTTDSLDVNNKYEYHSTVVMPNYHSNPVFTVQQKDMAEDAFGIVNYDLWDNNKKYVVPVYDPDDQDGPYKFDYPLFVSGDSYTFNISGYEEYINKDNADDPIEDIVPLSGTVVTISNALSASQKVYTENGTTTDGTNVALGEVCDLQDNEIALDSLGQATYTWKAGLPNISEPYTRGISMSYEINGTTYDWKGGKGLYAIILGSMPTGNNFVSAGPDHLSMILRDPPGTNSSASWTSGNSVSYSHSEGGCWSMDASTTFTTMLGVETAIITGVGVASLNDVEAKDNLTTGARVTTEGEDANTVSVSISSSRTVSTKDTPEYVGAGGDVFIGTATNILFGEANNVGLYRDPDTGVFSLELKSILTAGQHFGTMFQYDQIYIENTLLPNLVKLRNSMLKYYGADETIPANNTKYLQYVSRIPENDPLFGSSNSDDVWGSEAVAPGEDGKSYYVVRPIGMTNKGIKALTDSVNWCNLQIAAWEGYLAQNEEEKVKAFEEREKYLESNLSFDTGADVEQTYEIENTTGTTYEHTTGASVILNNELGFAVNKTGVLWTVETETGGFRHSQTAKDTTQVVSFSYTLSEDGDDDALTVDVYNYGDYSRIFRTRGGQTCGPYEGEVQTKYYKPGTVIMEATQQIEVPEIEAMPAVVSNIPSGSSATFTLRLMNQSQIGEDVYYKLLMIDETNRDGAIIKIDGMPLTEGRLIKVPAGETVTKSLQLSQSNYSILSYENIGIVLASQVQYDPTSTWDQIADTCWISAYFVPSASPVTMQLSNTLINTKSVTDANPDPILNITFKGFDRNYDRQKAFRIQYRQSGDIGWTLLREYVLDQSKPLSGNQEYLEDVASVTYPFNMKSMDDGEYTFRVVSVCAYGTNEEVTVESDEITVTKDMKRPQVLGTPKPSTGILTQGDDIAITFNEDINQNLLTDSNFTVTAQLNEATIANDVAVRATGEQSAAASTEAKINLDGKEFAMDMWVNYSSAGTFVTHGGGNNKFTIGVNEEGYFNVYISGVWYTSTKTIEKDKWCYLALSYRKSDGQYYLSALCANDASTTMLFNEEPVIAYSGNGCLSVLSGITASLHDLTLWDEAVSLSVLQSERNTMKKPSTNGLIGCWRFDEGQGLSAADKARNRNMVLAASNGWYMNVANKSVQFDGTNYVSLNTSACPIPSTNDYAVEMWFKADSEQQTAQPTLFSVGSDLVLRLTDSGQMELVSGSDVLKLGSAKYIDGQWHNFALNVLRNGTATVYIDGTSVAQTDGANIGNMQSDAMILGAKRTYSAESGYTFSDYFKGAIDDVRIWDASMNASVLRGGKDTRLAGTEEGLVAYYPFEKTAYDEGNQPYTATYLGDKTGGAADATSSKAVTYTDGPAQNPAKEMTGVGFSYVASERTIVINLTEDADLIEGTTVNLTVKNVQDMNGNSSKPVKWIVYINKNQLKWKESELSVRPQFGSSAEFTATVVNNSAVTEQWSISGMPSWLTADMTQGTLTALTSQKINFTVGDAVQLGRHDVTLYLSGNNGIEVPLLVEITVTGDEPDWAVNPNAYPGSMTFCGQIWTLTTPPNLAVSENTDDMIAAFIDGECRGVGHPVYYPRYDCYFTQLMVYGDTDDEGKRVEFKIWNAAEGKVYPVVYCYKYGEATESLVDYSSNAMYGNPTELLQWNPANKIEETLTLNKGWNWMSLYVDNTPDMSLPTLLKDINTEGNSITAFDNFARSEKGEWSSDLSGLNVGQMYMIKSVANDTLTMKGKEVSAENYPITITENWNWIGLNASYRIGINQAFADLDPTDGDLVKSQTAFAMYDGYEWVGNLTSLAPGGGYMYHSLGQTDKEFHYPSYASVVGTSGAKERLTASGQQTGAELAEEVVDVFDFNESIYSNYPTNMTIVARVMDGDEVLTDAQVGVFAEGECREAQTTNRGLVFLTIPGDKAEKLQFKVVSGVSCYSISQTAAFSANSHLGTLDNPYILQISGATAISDVDAIDDADVDAYNTAGLKVGEGYRGVVIKQGEKHLEKK